MAQTLANNIRLIASDLDGTLLRNYVKEVDPKAYPIIERVCDTGALFFAASGRQYASLRALFAPIADRIGYICENGALAVLNDEILVRREMTRDIALDICKLAESIPGCDYAASAARTIYVPSNNPAFIDHMANVVRANVTPIDSPEDIPESIIKVAFHLDNHDDVPAAWKIFSDAFGDVCHVMTSGTFWVDVMERGISKAYALSELSRILNIPTADMAAFGDEENDRTMLELVGHPYLMDPCGASMLDIAKLPGAKRCTCVEDELRRLMGEI